MFFKSIMEQVVYNIMDKKQIATGTAGILGIFLTIIGTVYFTPEQLDNSYICQATGEVGIFYGGISSTGLDCITFRTGGKICAG